MPLRLAGLLLRLLGHLASAPICLFRGGTGSLGGFVGEPASLGKLLRGILHQLLGSMLGVVGLALGVLDLLLHRGPNVTPARLALGFGFAAFPLHQPLRGLGGLGDTLFDRPAGLTFDLLDPAPALLDDLTGELGAGRGFLSRLDGAILSLPCALARLPCSAASGCPASRPARGTASETVARICVAAITRGGGGGFGS